MQTLKNSCDHAWVSEQGVPREVKINHQLVAEKDALTVEKSDVEIESTETPHLSFDLSFRNAK